MFKLLLSLMFSFNLLFSCDGDCLSCHPKLISNIENDTNHKPMKTCINCHNSVNINKMAECGSDCFACHKISKIENPNIKEHNVIRGCRDCHLKMKEKFILTPFKNNYLKDEILNISSN
jgi:hypothetical protein